MRLGQKQRESGLEGRDSVHTPAGDQRVLVSKRVGESLALPKRQVQHVADHRALIHVVAEERVFSIQVVVVLDRAFAAGGALRGWLGFQEAVESVCIRKVLRPRVVGQQSAARTEALDQLCLQRVVIAVGVEFGGVADVTVKRVGPETLTHGHWNPVQGRRVQQRWSHRVILAGEFVQGKADPGQVRALQAGVADLRHPVAIKLVAHGEVPLLHVGEILLGNRSADVFQASGAAVQGHEARVGAPNGLVECLGVQSL